MSARGSVAGLAASEPPLRRVLVAPWLSVAVSAALHTVPLLLPLQDIARQVLPLRPSEVQVDVVHEAAAPDAAAALAPRLEPAPAAAAVPAVSRRAAAPRVAASPPSMSAQPAQPQPEPAVAAEPPAQQSARSNAIAAAPAGAESQLAAPSAAPLAAPSAMPLAAPTALDMGLGVGQANGSTGTSPGLGSGAAGAGRGAGAAAGGPDLAALRGRYLGQLRERVLARREYPHLARRARLEGTVCLRIAVDAGGRLAQVRPTCAAPAPLLEAALRAVREAAPFGPLPSGLGSELVLDLPMVFQLDAG